MKMKIPSNNTIGNGYYNYGETYMLDNSENGTPANSSSLDECDSPTTDGDFSEYLWMENEEEFDKEVMQQLEEEALMEQCIEAMLEDELTSQEESQWSTANPTAHPTANPTVNLNANTTSNTTATATALSTENNMADINQQMTGLNVQDKETLEMVKASKLNPLAAEFVPSTRPAQEQKPATETPPARDTTSS